jgi:FkbM family methyltransferase
LPQRRLTAAVPPRTPALRAWRRISAGIAAVPIPDRVRNSPRLHRNLWPARVAPYVSPSRSLIAAELLRRDSVRCYRLRDTGLVIHLRHPHCDMWMLDEIFHRGVYGIPQEVRRALADLDRPPRILDLGAHVGLAALFLAGELPGASVVSFEPDPGNLAVLRRTITANAGRVRWELVAAAAAPRDGVARFVSDAHQSYVVGPTERARGEIEVATRDVFPHLAEADLVKIDVQGAEWELLTDARFHDARPRALVIEYHPYRAPGPSARTAVEAILREAGYRWRDPVDEHADEGTIWAWRANAGD